MSSILSQMQISSAQRRIESAICKLAHMEDVTADKTQKAVFDDVMNELLAAKNDLELINVLSSVGRLPPPP